MRRIVIRKVFTCFLFLCLLLNTGYSQVGLTNQKNSQSALSCDNWLHLPSQPSWVNIGDLDITGNKLTIEAQINIKGVPPPNGVIDGLDIVSKHTAPSNVNYLLRSSHAEITTTNGFFFTPIPCGIDMSKTYHVAMVYDGVTLKYYRNGFLLAQTPCTGDMIQNDFPTGIGFISTLIQAENFIGYLNEVRIWNVARTQNELRSYMNSSLPNPTTQTGLLAYYTFDNLINKQGNASWNGTLVGSASINQTNPECSFVADSCEIPPAVNVIASFNTPDTVCVNEPVNISNTSQNATSYFWNFCSADPNVIPVGTNLANPGNLLSAPVFSDIVKANGNYYVFVTNNWPGKLVRLDFGASLFNTPLAVDLGNFGGIIPNTTEGIQMIFNNGKWYALIVGGDPTNGIPSRILKLDFGANITNISPVVTNWGNIGNLAYPVDLHVFQENGEWYGLTINAVNNTITRFYFTNSLDNTPTGVNLGNLGGLNYPSGIYAINNNGNWHVFIPNDIGNSLVRLDFGNSLLNTPTAVNLGNLGGVLNKPRDIYIMKDCDRIAGFIVNGQGINQLIKLDFNNDLISVPVAANLGNVGTLNFPHSISELFRVGNDLYSFVTNVGNNSITRLRFQGCSNSSIPSSTVQSPPTITYSAPGTYNINLTVDDGLPTQTSFCKQIVVKSCLDSIIINKYTEVSGWTDLCHNVIEVGDASDFFVGDTVLVIQMKGAVIDSTNTTNFGAINDYRNAGNYEFNYIKSKNGNRIELLNSLKRQYDFSEGKVQLVRVPYFTDYSVTKKLTCLPWDGIKGGVLAFNVQNSLILNADIDVSGKGFKGGVPLNNSIITCNEQSYFYDPTSNNGGQKGEGLHQLSVAKNYGRGSPSNAGGGGNAHNSGGGGGGNAGVGGQGGDQWEGCKNIVENVGGKGGKALTNNATLNKLFSGGGGGMGHGNNLNEFPAGNGGGIIIFSTNSINANGKLIKANGDTAIVCNGISDCNDGMSGGGAGGSILLDINNINGNTVIEAKGGNGANSYYFHPVDINYKVGPGGGGGGGFIAIKQPAVSPQLLLNVAGGNNGVSLNHNNNPYGATPGNNGTIFTSFDFFIDTELFKPNIDSVRINRAAISCSSFNFEGLGYTNTHPVASWQWSFGDNTTASAQNTSHTYTTSGNYPVKLIVTDINGCKDSITINIEAGETDFDFNYDLDVCNPLTVQFNGLGSTITNPYWDFGDNNITTGSQFATHTYTSSGNYVVKYSVGNGVCTDTLTKTITISVINDNSLISTTDTTICYGTGKQLRTNPSLSFCWSPTIFLDNPLSPQPVTSATENITYYFTAETTGNNLIVNGDFSQGNTGFTSEYSYSNPNTTEGQYFIGTNPKAWNGGLDQCGDHTAGNGTMMIVNGSPVPDVNVWKQTVTVAPNTNYAFSTWIESLFTPNPAQLQFSINGKNVGTLITATLPTCNWTQFYTTWNSGNNTTAVISIVNKNLQIQGNDFALDDISFAPVYIKRDSVKIMVDSPLVKTNIDTVVCAKSPVQLNTTGAQAYLWTPSDNLSDVNIANPIASPVIPTQYIVTGINANGCIAKDSVMINIFTTPAIDITEDTTICRNTSVQLLVSGGASYNWSPSTTLNDPLSPNPIASPADNTIYYVAIKDNNNCSYLDSVTVSLSPVPVFAVNDAVKVCLNDSIQLTASGGDIYNWQPAIGLNNTAISNPKASPQIDQNYFVTITETTCNESTTLSTSVTVSPLPDIKASRSNDIDCSNDRSQLNATGGTRYEWTPSSTLNNNNISNPVAKPVTTTKYVVKGFENTSSCINYDSVVVKVDSSNKGGYLMPNAFTPNGDGLNDCFGIGYWGIIQNLEFSIYNRWGVRVFYTSDPDKCWDGRYRGVEQNSDVFVYMIMAKTTCESLLFRKGTFVLIR